MKKDELRLRTPFVYFAAVKGWGVDAVCREHDISAWTYHRWKKKYGGLSPKEAQRLKALERESDQLKKIVADQLLPIRALEIALEKNA